MTDSKVGEYYDGAICPWVVVKDICEYCSKGRPIPHNQSTVTIWPHSQRTLGIILTHISPTGRHSNRTAKADTPIRIERFNLTYAPEQLERFDTIMAALSQGKESARIILQMLATSLQK